MAIPTFALVMLMLDRAMVHELPLLVYILAALVKAIWPNGMRR